MAIIGELILTAVLLTACTAVHAGAKVHVVPPHSQMEDGVVASFRNDGFDEVSMEYMRSFQTDYLFRYQLRTKRRISNAYLIPPSLIYLNGTQRVLEENRDFRIIVGKKTIVLETKHVGFFHLSIRSRVKSRGKRAIATSNRILNAGMTRGCENICDSQTRTCSTDLSKDLPTTNIQCPPNNECNIASDDAVNGMDENGNPIMQPVGNATVVKTCDEFIAAVMGKFTNKGGKVDVYVDAHGNNGVFVIGEHGGTRERVSKGSACYNKICSQLKNKIKTLSLFTCSTAGGTSGPTFLQCLANCLNTNVTGFKKSVTATWTTQDVSSLVWSTARDSAPPCKFTPTPPPATGTPSGTTPTPSQTTASPLTEVSTETGTSGTTATEPTKEPGLEPKTDFIA